MIDVEFEGRNQTMVRKINRRVVVELLRDGAKSCTEIASTVKLSNTAVGKIVQELKALNIVTASEEERPLIGESPELGRKPVLYCLKSGSYMSAAINLNTRYITLYDLTGRVIAERSFPRDGMFTVKKLMDMSDALMELIQEFSKMKLLSICIITFGMLNAETGEYVFANRFEDARGINLVNMFSGEFSVPVSVFNDVRLNLYAEQEEGWLQEQESAVLLQVDTGIAAALMFDGKVYTGKNGFAGEVGLMRHGLHTLEQLSSIEAIENDVAEALKDQKQPVGTLSGSDWKSIVAKYRGRDKLVTEIVHRAAGFLSATIANMIQLCDCDIILCGRITELGKAYLTQLHEMIKVSDYNQCRVRFSEIPFEHAVAVGTRKAALDSAYEVIL